MRTGIRFFFASFILALLSAPTVVAAEDLNSVLARLNASSANFRSASADARAENVMTDPIPDTEVQKGVVYFERKNGSFQTAAHIHQINGQPVPKMYVYSRGTLKLWEGGNLDQVTTFAKATNFEGYLSLGFGASGNDLASKWDIKYDGPETINGVKTEKLELVAKDPAVRKFLAKVILWVDPDRDVSLKQYFDEGQGQSRTCVYSNIKLNQRLPGDAFTFKTDSQTRFVNR